MRIIYDRACCGYDIFVSEVKVIRFISPCRRKGTLRISKDDSFTARELEYIELVVFTVVLVKEFSSHTI